mmetsp:Transcript_27123/g.81786  ORF Transcript_27123/g.81786 Transcript_27123/m.81786 type:complete len:219 (-) Transcript_27123:47-703(-)
MRPMPIAPGPPGDFLKSSSVAMPVRLGAGFGVGAAASASSSLASSSVSSMQKPSAKKSRPTVRMFAGLPLPLPPALPLPSTAAAPPASGAPSPQRRASSSVCDVSLARPTMESTAEDAASCGARPPSPALAAGAAGSDASPPPDSKKFATAVSKSPLAAPMNLVATSCVAPVTAMKLRTSSMSTSAPPPRPDMATPQPLRRLRRSPPAPGGVLPKRLG